LYSLTSEVTAYLPLPYRLQLSSVDCGVELHCHVVTRHLVGRGRCWTTSHAVSLPEVRGGVEGGCDCVECCRRMPGEWWYARSMRLRGRAVGRCIFCLDGSFLDVASSWCRRWLVSGWKCALFIQTSHCSTCPAIG